MLTQMLSYGFGILHPLPLKFNTVQMFGKFKQIKIRKEMDMLYAYYCPSPRWHP